MNVVQEMALKCPPGSTNKEVVEIKCGSSSKWAVIKNPSINAWNPICHTRSSQICVQNKHNYDKNNIGESGNCRNVTSHVQTCRATIDSKLICKTEPETTINCGTPNEVSDKDIKSEERAIVTSTDRVGLSMLENKNYLQPKKISITQCKPKWKNVQRCHRIPVPWNNRLYTTKCETVRELKSDCKNYTKLANNQQTSKMFVA